LVVDDPAGVWLQMEFELDDLKPETYLLTYTGSERKKEFGIALEFNKDQIDEVFLRPALYHVEPRRYLGKHTDELPALEVTRNLLKLIDNYLPLLKRDNFKPVYTFNSPIGFVQVDIAKQTTSFSKDDQPLQVYHPTAYYREKLFYMLICDILGRYPKWVDDIYSMQIAYDPMRYEMIERN
jgi:hypothetical protein